MKAFWDLLPTSGKLLAVVLAIMVVILVSVITINQPPTTVTPSPTPQKISPIQRGIPDMPISDIEPQLDILNKEASSDGTVVYDLESDNPLRPDQIISKDGKVVYERVYIPEEPTSSGYLTLDQVEQRFGEGQILNGSNFWGDFMKTYVYPDLGYAFIANPYTREVFEMQIFKPISLDEYKKIYGSDISDLEFFNEGL